MFWSLVTVGVAGVLLGIRFRAPALIAATAVTVVASSIARGRDGLFDGNALLSTLLLVVTLQCAYLVGLVLAVVWRRSATNSQ